MGIFTRQDVIGRIVLPGVGLGEPIGGVMSAPVITLPMHATAGDAAVAMARRGIRHIVLVDESGSVAGVVSERDLFGSAAPFGARARLVDTARAGPAVARAVRLRRAGAVVRTGRAGRRERAAHADDLEPERPAGVAAARRHRAASRPVRRHAVLDRHGQRRALRADDRHRPGQRAHLRRQRSRCGARRDTRSAPAVRPRGQRGPRRSRLPAVQGRGDGDEPQVVRLARRVAGRVLRVDRPRGPAESPRGEHLLRLPGAVGRGGARGGAARRHRRARAGQSALPEADERQRAHRAAAAQLDGRDCREGGRPGRRRHRPQGLGDRGASSTAPASCRWRAA